MLLLSPLPHVAGAVRRPMVLTRAETEGPDYAAKSKEAIEKATAKIQVSLVVELLGAWLVAV
eukprot:351609-Chlamydomonas_euryale.AAC.2